MPASGPQSIPVRPRGYLPEPDPPTPGKIGLLAAILLHLGALAMVFPASKRFSEAPGQKGPMIRFQIPRPRAHEAPEARTLRAPRDLPTLSLPGDRDPTLAPPVLRSGDSDDPGAPMVGAAPGFLLTGAYGPPLQLDEKQLVRTRFVEPEYPGPARRLGVEGTVVLSALVDSAGRIVKVEVIQGRPWGLSEAAVEAVQDWEYEPAVRHGTPTHAWVTIRVHFRLEQ